MSDAGPPADDAVDAADATDADPGGGDAGAATLLVTERDTPKGTLIAVCDADLLGETFENGRVSLTVTEEFYGGDPADADAARAALGRASVANLVGTEAVELAIDAGFVDEENVLEVGETLHAQYLRL